MAARHGLGYAAAMFVNKVELSKILQCSLPTLDRLLERHAADFPIVARGSNGVEWKFDAEAVLAFLQAREAAAAAAGRARDDLMRQYTLPGTDDADSGTLSPANLLKLAQLRRLEREEQKEAGFLLQTTEVRPLLTNALAKFNRDLGTAIRQGMREHNVPDTTIRSVEARIAEAQRRIVAELQNLLVQADSAGDQGASLF
jgi:phage terminase Nu1 subunit (DNA packaging protein)